jgi:hypothetical protein
MVLVRVGIAAFALTFAACSQLPAAHFGTIDGLSVVETHHIPYAVGTHYGFRIDYHDSGHPVILREEFHLPGPAHWHSAQKFVAHSRGSIMTREVQLGSHTRAPPEIHGIYIEDLQIARGDPKGDYTVQLSLDGKAWKDFQFSIE